MRLARLPLGNQFFRLPAGVWHLARYFWRSSWGTADRSSPLRRLTASNLLLSVSRQRLLLLGICIAEQFLHVFHAAVIRKQFDCLFDVENLSLLLGNFGQRHDYRANQVQRSLGLLLSRIY